MAIDLQFSSFELTNATANLGRLGQTFRLGFKVRCSAKYTMAEIAAYLWSELPWSLAYWGLPYAILDTYECKPEDENERTVFTGSATYKQSDYSGQATFVEFSYNKYDEVLWKARDTNGKEVAVVNSAGDRFEDPLKETYQRKVIRISKCYPLSISPVWFDQFRDTVNLNNIMIADTAIPRRAGIIRECVPVIQVVSRVEYAWRFNIEIEVKNPNEPCPTWDRDILDCGYYILKPVLVPQNPPESVNNTFFRTINGRQYYRLRAITFDEMGKPEPSETPILLDGHGGKLEDCSPGNEVYLRFQTKDATAWEELRLPRTMWEVLFVG